MSFIDTALQMLVLAIPMAIGFLANRLALMGGEFDGKLSRLVLNVTLPCMILVSVDGRELPAPAELAALLGLSAVGYLIAIAIALAAPRLLRAPTASRGALGFIIAFGNVGFIGFPVLSAILGPGAVLYAAIANIPWFILSSSLGVLMISGIPEGDARSVIGACARRAATPMLFASAVVLAFALCGVNELGVLGEGLAACGAFTTPAALLISGSALAKYSVREMVTSPRAYAAAALRLLGVPLALWVVLAPFAPSSFILAIIVLGQAMPAATNGILCCLMYDVDPRPMTQGMFLSVIGSIGTIPLLALLVL